MDIQAIADRTTLVTLSTGMWRATRLHKRETKEENARHAAGDRARVFTRLSDHPALGKLAKLHSAAHDGNRKLSLPSVQDGIRVLARGVHLEHSAMLQDFERGHLALAAEYCADYEADKAAAPARLNGLYDPAMWPDVGAVRSSFSFGWRYLATPTEGAWGEWLAESARAAEDELRERLVDALRRVAERCSGDGKLYETVFSNLADICRLVPHLNLTDDPIIAAAAARALSIAATDVEVARDSDKVRRAAADAAADVLSMFPAGSL